MKFLWNILFLFVFTLLMSITLHAQQVSISAANRFIQPVLKSIEDQAGVRFSYDVELIRGKKITLQLEGVTLEEALEKIGEAASLDYKISGKTIILFEKEAPAESPVASSGSALFNWRGWIVDRNSGEPLPYALIRVKGSDQYFRAEVDGKVSIINLPVDTCQLLISYLGYEDLVVKAANLANANGRIKLRPFSIDLPQAVVEDHFLKMIESSKSPGEQLVRPEQFGTVGGSGEADVMRVAQLLPGISGTSENSGGLNIRGSDTDQALVCFDDFTIYHLDHFFGVFSALNANAVKQLIVHKGSPSARFGGRAGGVVEVVGKEGNIYAPSIQLNLGALSGGLTIETPVGNSENASFFFTARRSFTDKVQLPVYKSLFNTTYGSGMVLTGSSDNAAGGSTFYFEDATVKLSYRPSAKDHLHLSAYGGKDNLSISYGLSNTTEGLSAFYQDESVWGNRGIGFRWTHDVNERLSLHTGVGWSRYRSDLFAIDTLTNEIFGISEVAYRNNVHELRDLTYRVESIYRRKNHALTFGAEISRWSLNTRERLDITFDTLDQEGRLASFYINDAIHFRKWTIEPGLRISSFSKTSALYPEWRSTVTRRLNSSWTLKLNVGRVHQFIHRYRQQSLFLNYPDTWRLSGNDGLPVLKSDQFASGFHYERKGWTVDVEAYVKRNQGTFEFLGPYQGKLSGIDADYVVGNGWSRGCDVMVGRDFNIHHVWLAYGLLKAENKFAELDNIWVPELFDQRHEVKLSYQVIGQRWEGNALFLFGSGKPYTPFLGSYEIPIQGGGTREIYVFGDLNSARLPVYHRLDVGVTRKFVWNNLLGKLQFSIFNTYNHKNVRDIRYVYSDQVIKQEILMQGFLPSFLLQLQWR